MARSLALAAALLGLPAVAGAQQIRQALIGVLRDTTRAPLGGAEVQLDKRVTSTNAQGQFRFDSLPAGRYPLTIRMIGYHPVRTRVTILELEPTRLELFMVPAPMLLPAIVVEIRRSGIFGKVGDTAYRALRDAKVSLLGPRGGEVLTDSLGYFAFPDAGGGTYMVRVTKPGYTERRISIDLPSGKGRDLGFLLAPVRRQSSGAADAAALFDLDRRLSFELRRSRMSRSDMERYGSMALCDVPRVRAEARGGQTDVLLNGIILLREVSLCSWRMDEVELVEFGSELRLGLLTGAPPPRSGRRRDGFVILWERR